MTKLSTDTIGGFDLAMMRTVASIPFAILLIMVMRLKLPRRGRDLFDIIAVAMTGLIGFPVLFTMGVAYTLSLIHI